MTYEKGVTTMSDKLENQMADTLEKVTVLSGQFIDKLDGLAEQYGPDVVAMGLNVARMDAGAPLFQAVALLTLVAVFWAKLGVPWVQASMGKGVKDWIAFRAVLTGCAGGPISVVIILIYLPVVLDPWRWVGVFYPTMWMAKKALGL